MTATTATIESTLDIGHAPTPDVSRALPSDGIQWPAPMSSDVARLVVRRRIEHLMAEIDLRCDDITLSDSAVRIGELVREVSCRLVLIVEAAAFFPQESQS